MMPTTMAIGKTMNNTMPAMVAPTMIPTMLVAVLRGRGREGERGGREGGREGREGGREGREGGGREGGREGELLTLYVGNRCDRIICLELENFVRVD